MTRHGPSIPQLFPPGFTRSPTGLWLPSNEPPATKERSHSLLDFLRTTVGFERVFNRESTKDAVTKSLRQYSLEEVVSAVSRISAILSHYSGPNVFSRAQAHIIRAIFGKDRSIYLYRRAASQSDSPAELAFFQERQTLNLLKLAFLTLDLDAIANVGASLAPLGEALLMINDILDRDIASHGDMTQVENVRSFELYLFANIYFNQATSALASFARAHELFIRPRSTKFNLAERLRRATGLEPKLFWWGLRMLHSFYVVPGSDQIDKNAAVLSRRSAFDRFRLSAAQKGRIFDAATLPAADMQQEVSARWSLEAPRFFDLLPFAKHPLVSFGDRIYCTSLQLLRDLAGMNVQHRLLDGTIFTEAERQEFLEYRGNTFQKYLRRLLVRTFGEERVIGELQLRRHAMGSKYCDAVVLYGHAVLLFEFKAAIAPLSATTAESWDTYQAKVSDACIGGAQQLDSTIRLIEEGVYIPFGLKPEALSRYIPIISTLDLLVSPVTHARILSELESWDTLQIAKAAPLQIFDVSEMELIETAAAHGESVLGLIQDKLSQSESVTTSFKNWCYARGNDWFNAHNPYLSKRFSVLRDEMEEFTRELLEPSGSGQG